MNYRNVVFGYPNLIEAVTRATSVDDVDSTAKLSWSPDRSQGWSMLSRDEKLAIDAMAHARLHHELNPTLWNVLVIKYSTSTAAKVAALEKVWPVIATPADARFTRHAATAWAFPKPKGMDGKRSTAVLPAGWYDFNNWDTEGRSDTTRRRWNARVKEWLESMVSLALIEAQHVLDEEGLIRAEAA